MKPRTLSRFRLPAALAALLVFSACHLGSVENDGNTFSFPSLPDSLASADHATIVLKDTLDRVIDTLFDGPVHGGTRFSKLEAEGYDGGLVVISIVGTQDGQVIYREDRRFDGSKGDVVAVISQVHPGASVKIQSTGGKLALGLGDELPLPAATVLPSHLADKSLGWASRQPDIFQVTTTHLQAKALGSAYLVATLTSDTVRKDSVLVEVVAKVTPIKNLDSLRLFPDILPLALRGPAGRFTVKPYPANGSAAVSWASLDTSVAVVDADGNIAAVSEGFARIVATSIADAAVSHTAQVEVIPAVKVDSVRFEKDLQELFVLGSAESLLVRVYPPLANPSVEFQVRDGSIAKVSAGKIQGLKEGDTWVLAKSLEDPTRIDSLQISVFPSVMVDSVRLVQDSLNLYVRGESLGLTASIFPSTLQSRFLWRSAKVEVAVVDASGKVSPVAPGKVYVSVSARADSTKRDSALVIVKRDVPRIQVGGDTIIAAGASVTHRPVVAQDYGQVVLFKWDLDGDGTFEDSSTAVPASLSHVYAEAKEHLVRFLARDTEGNDSLHVRKVKAVHGRVVQITDPKDGAQVNITPITITWTVDGGAPQVSSQTLTPGENSVTRSAQDSAGNSYSHTIKVTLDQAAPNRPTVKGPTLPINTLTPTWTWASGGGGNGTFRYRIDDPDLSTAATTTDTFHTASANLAATAHILYVQERDEAGNWSVSGSFSVRIDTAKPAVPTVTLTQGNPTNERRPTWNWTQAEAGPGFFRYSLDNAAFRDTGATNFRPAANLADGSHTVRVQERDSAGNWSDIGSKAITIDATPPASPVFDTSPRSPVGSLRPTWNWSTGGNGGAGEFRYKLDNGAYSAWSAATSYQPPTQPEGAHTLFVQERDAVGNESVESSRSLVCVARGPLGPNGLSFPNSYRVYSATSNSGILHVTATDESGSKVYSYTNGWSVLGNTTFSATGYAVALAFSRDTAFVAVQEPIGDEFEIRVRKFAQGSWQHVGTSRVDSGFFYGVTMAIGTDGIPYVCLINGLDYSVQAYRFNRTNGNWALAGNTVGSSTDDGGYSSIAVNASNEVYVAYTDFASQASGRPTVKKLAGSSWNPVTSYPSPGSHLELAFHGNIPFLSFVANNRVTLVEHTSGWTPINEYSILGDEPTMGISRDGIPYLAFKTLPEVNNVNVVTPIGGSLVMVGPSAASSHYGSAGLNVTVSPAGIPQVAFVDKSLGSSAAVYQFGFDP